MPRVAIGVAAARADHERRVADNQVELLAGDRLEQVTGARVDLDPGQHPGQLRERRRPRVAVGGDQHPGVPAGQQRLHPVARPDVQQPRDGSAGRRGGQRKAGRADAQHLLGLHLCRRAAGVVGDGDVCPAVRDGLQPYLAGDGLTADQPAVRQPRSDGLRPEDGLTEHQDPGQHLQR